MSNWPLSNQSNSYAVAATWSRRWKVLHATKSGRNLAEFPAHLSGFCHHPMVLTIFCVSDCKLQNDQASIYYRSERKLSTTILGNIAADAVGTNSDLTGSSAFCNDVG